MIIVMKRGASPEQLKHVEDRVREAEMVPHTIHGVERHVIAAVGEERHITPEFFKVCPLRKKTYSCQPGSGGGGRRRISSRSRNSVIFQYRLKKLRIR